MRRTELPYVPRALVLVVRHRVVRLLAVQALQCELVWGPLRPQLTGDQDLQVVAHPPQVVFGVCLRVVDVALLRLPLPVDTPPRLLRTP